MIHEPEMYSEMNTGQTTLSFASNEMASLNRLKIRENSINKNSARFEKISTAISIYSILKMLNIYIFPLPIRFFS